MKRAAGCGLDFRPCIVGRTAFAAPVITNSFRHSLFALGDGEPAPGSRFYAHGCTGYLSSYQSSASGPLCAVLFSW